MIEKIPLTEVQIAARSPAYSYQDLLDKETNDVPDALRSESAPYLGSDELPIERWTSREFHDLEVEKLWSKTWQMACRESQVAKAGDYFVYDIVDRSVVITRTQDGELKAHHNSCLHRGRALKRGAGKNATELRCPYHGFTWELSGEFREMPCKWDFPHINKDDFHCPVCAWTPGEAGCSSTLMTTPNHWKSTWAFSRSTSSAGLSRIATSLCMWKGN